MENKISDQTENAEDDEDDEDECKNEARRSDLGSSAVATLSHVMLVFSLQPSMSAVKVPLNLIM